MTARTGFFDEDFDELRRSGYLLAAVPTELGGGGLGLDGYARLVRRLAYVAPATALAVNMHCYWTGVAADLLKAGDESCRWVLEQAVAGEVFNALHGEAGNDLPLLLAVATATRVEGGWEISGHKIFGSLSPAWTYGAFHAMDSSDPANPRIVHGFPPRTSTGYQVVETWDTLGMRATQSHDPTRWRTTPRSSTRLPRCASPTTPRKRCWNGPAPTGPPAWSIPIGPARLIATRHFVINQAYGIVDRALDLSGGAAAFKTQPPPADLPRRPHGTLPPRQHPPRPRAHRQALPRHRPRCTAAMGLTAEHSVQLRFEPGAGEGGIRWLHD